MIAFDLQPLATGLLPSGCYIPEGWFAELSITLCVVSIFFFFVMQGSDGLFWALTYSLVIQFKLLSYRFKTMKVVFGNSEQKMLAEIKQLVNYHNFLIKYNKTTNI